MSFFVGGVAALCGRIGPENADEVSKCPQTYMRDTKIVCIFVKNSNEKF